MKVVYGHTDSIYVQIDSVETAEKAIGEIENEVRKAFPNVLGLEQHPVVLEFEKYFSALGVGTTKNRNAGMITWKDGYYLDEQEFVMTGFTAKRVSETPLAKRVQTEVLKMWASQNTFAEINKYVSGVYHQTLNGELDKTEIIKRSRLKEERFSVKCYECRRVYEMKDITALKYCGENEGRDGTHKCGNSVSNFKTLSEKKPTIGSGVAGVIHAFQKRDLTFDDSYLFMKASKTNDTFVHPLTKEVRQVDYVAGVINSDLDDYTPDWRHYAEQVLKKAEPVYRAMDWDISSIRTGRIQSSLLEWF